MKSKIQPTFALRKKNASDKKGRVCVFISFTINKGESKRVVFPMKSLVSGKPFSIPVSSWDKENNRCFIRGSVEDKAYQKSINNQIDAIRIAVRQIVGECETHHHNISTVILSEARIYEKIKEIDNFTDAPEPTKMDFVSNYWEAFIERAKENKVSHGGKPYKPRAIVNYQKTLNGFKLYEKERRHHYMFAEIDHAFYEDFVGYMRENEKQQNTIGESIKNLKALMNRALLEGVHSNTVFKSFVVLNEEVDNVYLTEEEVERLYNYHFTEPNQMLDKYRDLFLIGCYTGLRWEDYKSLRRENFTKTAKGTDIIRIKAAKTGIKVEIPFIWRHLKDIVNKYDYAFPVVAEQNFNEHIKVACMLAEINAPVLISSGKHKRDKPWEKWELVSSHTARRTACTNMYRRGIPAISIMKISGHKRESTFMKYIKITAEENADLIAEKYAEKD